ncbi:MAG: M48 family metallopeptidase [Clostridia bacterium]|nr:M48 family metallopeptidase [Clostridia bacterium]
MYEDIKKNKIKTGVIVFLFTLMIAVIIYAVCEFLGLGEYTIVFAAIFSIISAIATYYNCDKIVLASVKARPATREEDLQLTNILDGLMVASGLEAKPRLYVVDSNQPNAFATGRNPQNAVICVTTGLIEKLNYRELEAVVAHELSHIKNYDIRLSAVISVMAGFVVMLSDILFRSRFRGRRNDDNDSHNSLEIILMLVGLILLILSPIISNLIQLAVSRRREYLADATAVSFTRNPDGLISALKKISEDDSELDVASQSNAFMYIENPFKKKRKEVSSLFSTHPSVAERVTALENLR